MLLSDTAPGPRGLSVSSLSELRYENNVRSAKDLNIREVRNYMCCEFQNTVSLAGRAAETGVVALSIKLSPTVGGQHRRVCGVSPGSLRTYRKHRRLYRRANILKERWVSRYLLMYLEYSKLKYRSRFHSCHTTVSCMLSSLEKTSQNGYLSPQTTMMSTPCRTEVAKQSIFDLSVGIWNRPSTPGRRGVPLPEVCYLLR